MIKIIAEIGINHNGSIEIAKKLIDAASVAGCDFVKFQKRNPEICVPEREKYEKRDTPWGIMSYIDYKNKIEFGKEDYDEINQYCKHKNIGWFASVWDKDSIDFMAEYTTILDGKEMCIMKIPSALITDLDLVRYAREKSGFLMISTGMSTEDEIMKCINESDPNLIFHTNSTYPSPIEDLKLDYINWLKDTYKGKEIGYSGHEFGLVTTFASVALGATWIERHVTLDRSMWGSDQICSVEPIGLIKLVKGIRDIEKSLGGYSPRVILESEKLKRKKLRK